MYIQSKGRLKERKEPRLSRIEIERLIYKVRSEVMFSLHRLRIVWSGRGNRCCGCKTCRSKKDMSWVGGG